MPRNKNLLYRAGAPAGAPWANAGEIKQITPNAVSASGGI